MQTKMGLESLVQRGKSAFFLEMTDLYQQSFDALRDHPKLSQEEVFFTLHRMGFEELLKTLVKKHMGITLSMVDIVESPSPNMFATVTTNRTYMKSEKARNKTPGMMMEEINRFYNDRKGRLEVDTTQPLPFKFKIILNTALWMIEDKRLSPFYTAEELAAATLHELGHVDHFVRVAFRIQERIIDAADIIDYTTKAPDKDVILSLITQLKTSPYLDKSWAGVLVATEKYFKTSNSQDDPAHWEALSTLSTLVTADVAGRNVAAFTELSGHRINDQVGTKLTIVDPERTADEFASRNGANRALIEMIAKSNQLATTKTDFVLRQFLWYTPSLILGQLVSFATTFNVFATDVAGGYDHIMRRLELINETAKHTLHDASLPDSVKSDILQQIAESDRYIRDYGSSDHIRIRSSIKTWKDNVSKFGRLLFSPVQNRLIEDYARLQNANRSLARHPLYYLAKK